VAGGGERCRPALRRLRAALLWLIALLYVVSIPWYRSAGEAPSLVLGFPDWVAVALGCYGLIAVLNALAWMIGEVPEREPGDEAGAREP
jgi:hypothetical protein